MAEPTAPGAAPQRRWEGPCPNCGAPVAFLSPTSAVAVCSYCRSTVARSGDTLSKIGTASELIQDRSRLQIGVTGQYLSDSFDLVGRVQYGYGEGETVEAQWNEWHAVFGNGRHGWLSEDNDQYVFTFDHEDPPDPLPTADSLKLGAPVELGRMSFYVASKVESRVLAAQGELPFAPPAGRFLIADLRDTENRVATLDYSDPMRPQLSMGTSVRLADLNLKNLGDAAAAAVKDNRSFECPECGAPLPVTRSDTQSISCVQCNSLVDIGKGVGHEIVTAQRQSQLFPPRKLALGLTGELALCGLPPKPWQILGFSRKSSASLDPEEQFSWDDYLLFNQEEGFAFLIDSMDGWVAFRTLTGVPDKTLFGSDLKWDGVRYELAESYPARVDYVDGEYYWQVRKDRTFDVQDFNGKKKVDHRLSLEVEGQERIWSAGRTLEAKAVSRAFGLPVPPDPTFLEKLAGFAIVAVFIVLVVLFGMFMEWVDRNTPDDGSGTSYSTGSHK